MSNASPKTTAGAWIFGVLLMVATAGLTGPAYAEKQKDIEAKGYSCETSGVDSVVCSKKGEKDYICDKAGTCTQMAQRKPGGTRVAPLPANERAR